MCPTENQPDSGSQELTLRAQLYAQLSDHTTGTYGLKLGLTSSSPALPYADLCRLLSKSNIERALPGPALEPLVDYICEKARRVYALVLLSLEDDDDQKHALDIFMGCQFSDDDNLPIANPASLPQEALIARKKNHSKLWEEGASSTFYNKQWAFLIHKFEADTFIYEEIHDRKILPFNIDRVNDADPSTSQGNFCEVTRAWMLASQQNVIDKANFQERPSRDGTTKKESNKWIDVAIKQLQLPREGAANFNLKETWRKEAMAHKNLNDPGHDHLVKAVAAFYYRGKHYLVLEWADSDDGASDLARFMKNNGAPQLDHKYPERSRGRVMEVLKQIKGLADGLNYMHRTDPFDDYQSDCSSDRSGRSSPTTPAPRLPDAASIVEKLSSSPECDTIPERTRLNSLNENLQIPRIQISDVNSQETDPESRLLDGSRSREPPAARQLAPAFDESILYRTAQSIQPAQPKVRIDSHSPDDSLLGFSRRRSVGTDDTRHYRHGDVKLDNILRFKGNSSDGRVMSWLGHLKLADLGRAQVQADATGLRTGEEEELFRAKCYEPPDLYLTHNKTISRLFDTWSLGCVIFELVQWMLYGIDFRNEWVRRSEYNQVRRPGGRSKPSSSPYWIIGDNDNARVSERAKSLMAHILDRDPEGKGALGELVRLVKDKLLVVRLHSNSSVYTPGCRTNAKDLGQELDAIIHQAENDPEYLYCGSDRKEVDEPVIEGRHSRSNTHGTDNSLSVRVAIRSSGISNATRIINQNEYASEMDHTWKYSADPHFAQNLFAREDFEACKSDLEDILDREKEELCETCKQSLLADRPIVAEVGHIRARKDQCGFCRMLFDYIQACPPETLNRVASDGQFKLERLSIGLRCHDRDALAFKFCSLRPGVLKIRIFRLYSEYQPADYSEDDDNLQRYPLSSPFLPEGGSDGHFEFLRLCLDDCEGHAGCRSKSIPAVLPKRLIDISNFARGSVRIVMTSNPKDVVVEQLRYTALSHKWGTDEFLTSNITNIKGYLKKISVRSLPQSFIDAIKITRALDMTYLWIDSLCIVQGPGGDYYEEAQHMEDIYSSAHCVLAASSSEGAKEGFLQRNDSTGSEHIHRFNLGTADAVHDIFITPAHDDFQADVLNSPLEKRGWVLQEHALARRTLFFTKRQTYFECGRGIRCETLTHLTNPGAAFLGQPHFPDIVVGDNTTRGDQIFYMEALFEKYSLRQFSRKEDRPVAIDGLMRRMTREFRTKSVAGVFERFWGRCILWERASGSGPLKRITLPTTQTQTSDAKHRQIKLAPSWSWMSYEDGVPIEFVEVLAKELEWNAEVKVHGMFDHTTSWLDPKHADALVAITASVVEFSVPVGVSPDKAGISYDAAEVPTHGEGRCFVVGEQKKPRKGSVLKCFIIVVQQVPAQSGAERYKRIGVGSLPKSYLGQVVTMNATII